MESISNKKVLTIQQEINKYQSFIKMNPSINFSEFWELYSENLTLLTKLVHEFSILLASSVPSESSFSEAGYLNNKHRASMHPTTLEYCMVLKQANEIKEDETI